MLRFLRRDAADDLPRYRTLAEIGQGGDAIVFRTFDTALHRIVAVKAMKKSAAASEESRRVFTREGRLIGYLDHPGVVPIYDHFLREDDEPCYALKLLGGETLGARLGYEAGGRAQALSVSEALSVFTRVAETLAFAHDRGVAHLDLKPDNVMVGRYGEVLLMDWGNARLFDAEPYRRYLGDNAGEEEIALLVDEPADLLSGTPHFMAPEQTQRPRSTLGPAADIFSAGVLLYLMLTGEVPFQGGDMRSLFRAIQTEPAPPLRSKNAEIPERLAIICESLLAKEEGSRPADLHEVLAELATFRDAGQAFPKIVLPPGDVLFREGDEGDAAYALVSGRVEVVKATDAGEQTLAELGPGEIVGEVALLTGERRSATVRVLEPTTVRVMGKGDVEAELEKVAPWVGAMVTTLGKRFLGLNDELTRLRRDDG